MLPRLFAVGDIHGCFDSFRALLEQKIKIRKTDKIVILGDFIDRGPQSKDVVDFIIDLQYQGFNILPLMGNHEAMLLESGISHHHSARWTQNGGYETLKSFGISSIHKIESKYIDFFNGLSYHFAHEGYLFVHAGFNDELADPFEDKHHMLWKCRESYLHPFFNCKTIIHGHSAIKEMSCIQKVKEKGKVLNIDTGCYYKENDGYGKLTALELHSMFLFSV